MNNKNWPTRLLRAHQIAGSVLILYCGSFAFYTVSKLPHFAKIFDNMVEGGVEALPVVAKFLLQHQTLLYIGFGLVIAAAIWFTFRSRRHRVIAPMIVFISVFLWTSAFALIALNQNILETVIAKFKE